MKVVALIPARGGSVRIPRKNMQIVGGLTLVARAIRAARECVLVSDVYVSTEDTEIADEARANNATVIDRPERLATPETPMAPVVAHFIHAAALAPGDLVALLEPSAPFRMGDQITAAIAYLKIRHDAFAVRTVTRVARPAHFLHTLGAEGFMKALTPEAYYGFAPAVYRDNGIANVFRVDAFTNLGRLWNDRVIGLEVTEPDHLVDVDHPEDLAIAQLIADEFDHS